MQRPSRSAVLVSAATAASLLGDQALYAVLPVYFDELGLTAIQVGVVLSANRWIRLATNQVARWATARCRGDWLFVLALLLGAGTTAAYAAAGHFSLLLAARMAWGLSWSFIRHVGALAVMDGVAADASGRIMGYYNGISRLGSVAGLLGGALLVDLIGFSPTMLVLAFISLSVVPVGRAGVTPGVVPSARADGVGSTNDATIYVVLGVVIGGVGAGFVMSTLGAALDQQLDGRLNDLGGMSAAPIAGALLAVRYVLDSVAAPWLGGLTDRYGSRRAVTAFLAAGGISLVVAAASGSILVMVAFTIVFFVAGTALHAGVAGIASSRGSGAFARYVTSLDLGAALGPLIGWLALDVYHNATVGIGLGGGTYLAAAIVAWVGLRGPPSSRRDDSPGVVGEPI